MITEYEQTAVEPLERYGIPYRIEHGGKHKAIVFAGHRYTMPSTPSDTRGAYNSRSDIMRILRADGVVKGRPLEPVVLFGDEPEADTRDVADYFDKNHADVLKATRAIRARANGDTRVKISEFLSSDLTGTSVNHYLLNKTAFTLLAMGFTGQKAFDWKLNYIEAFDRMSDCIRQVERAEHRALVDDHRVVVLRMEASDKRADETEAVVSELRGELSAVRGDMEALISLQLEQQPIIIIRKAPFVRPSLRRKSK